MYCADEYHVIVFINRYPAFERRPWYNIIQLSESAFTVEVLKQTNC